MKPPAIFPRAVAACLLVACLLPATVLAAPAEGDSTTAIRVSSASSVLAATEALSTNDSPITLTESQASGTVEVIYQDESGNKTTASITAVSTQTNTYACVRTGGSTLRVRQGPGTGYSVLCSVYNGDCFPVTGSTDGWYQILCNGRTGYVSADYVTIISSDSISSTGGDVASNPLGLQIAALALEYVGYPYVYGTAGPDTFDCSGFTAYIYAQFGYTLSRAAKDQADNGVAINKEDLEPGDLVLFSSNGSYVTHVAIYIGDGNIVHASTAKDGVKISSLDTTYYTQTYFGARRIV